VSIGWFGKISDLLKLKKYVRGRIMSEWQGCIDHMNACTSDVSTSDPATPQELRRVALTVALAISNPREP